jgi:hypothetical protein
MDSIRCNGKMQLSLRPVEGNCRSRHRDRSRSVRHGCPSGMGPPNRIACKAQSPLRLQFKIAVSPTHPNLSHKRTVSLTPKPRVIALAGLQIHYLAVKLNSSNQPLDGVATTICRQTEIFYAIMASTIPCLRPFLASFFTGFGAMGTETVIAGSQVGHSREKSGYALGSMESSQSAARREKRKSRGAQQRERERELDNFGIESQNRAHVSHDTGSSRRTAADASSITSNDSTKMIIKKEVVWQVDSEQGDVVRPL